VRERTVAPSPTSEPDICRAGDDLDGGREPSISTFRGFCCEGPECCSRTYAHPIVLLAITSSLNEIADDSNAAGVPTAQVRGAAADRQTLLPRGS